MTDSSLTLDMIKPGTKVFVCMTQFSNEALYPATVKKIGKTHVILETPNNKNNYPVRYGLMSLCSPRKHGRMYIGSPYYDLIEYSEENIKKYEMQKKRLICKKIINWLYNRNLRETTDETINAYYDILIQFKSDEKKVP